MYVTKRIKWELGEQVVVVSLHEECSRALVEWFTTDDDVGDHEAWGSEDADGLQDTLQVKALSHGFASVCPLSVCERECMCACDE